MRSGMPSWARQETAPATWKPFMIWKMLVCAGGDGRSAVICSSPLFVLGSERGSIHRIFVRDSTCAFVALRVRKAGPSSAKSALCRDDKFKIQSHAQITGEISYRRACRWVDL